LTLPAFLRRPRLALAAALLIALAVLCWHFDFRPHHWALRPIPNVLRTLLAIAVVFGLAGFGVVRLLLPDKLKRYELLWVLPAGGCVAGLELTVLGFAAVPYAISLALVLLGGFALSAYAVRRNGWPEAEAVHLAWPAYLTLIILAITLIPMVFVQHYDAVTGTGSDAHVATGVAQFLKHSYPTSVNLNQPINQMQPTWQSKYPIYYAFAAVSSVSALATWQVMPILIGTMFALAAIGLFLLALEMFSAPVTVALLAMAFAGLDRMALHTPMNPYFNQTWGYFAMPFGMVLGWTLVQPGLSSGARKTTAGLFVIFALVMVLAYPLAAPLPAVPLIALAIANRHRRKQAGDHVLGIRDLYRGRRSLIWLVPLAAALAIPIAGAVDKIVQAIRELLPGQPVNGSWRGDVTHYFAWNWFFSLPDSPLGYVLFALIIGLAVMALWHAPRPLAIGLGGLLLFGLAFGVYLRHLQDAYYFEFKLLAFVGPLIVLTAIIGAWRLRPYAAPLVAVLAVALGFSLVDQLDRNGYQLGQPTVALSSWAAALPPNASIRLDMFPPDQIWAGYFLDARPVCSEAPLLDTDYPHVAISRKADYIITSPPTLARPADAIGPVLRYNDGYALYRENPNVPGPSYCTRRRFDRLYTGLGYTPY
jgi:hypothetical protein